jgi:hypothetical protein
MKSKIKKNNKAAGVIRTVHLETGVEPASEM